MAKLKPFRAIRPRADLASTIAALPYDVYSRKEATDFVKTHRGSFLAIDRAETGLPASVDTYDEAVYERAASLLSEWRENGSYIQEEAPAFYLYELVMKGRSQCGIVGLASIDDYEQGVIKKHENTLAAKEADRIRHIEVTQAQTGPIFLAYRRQERLAGLIASVRETEPVYDFVDEEDVRQRVWIISRPEWIQTIQDEFEKIPSIYIADGHHRAASAVRVGQKQRAAHPDYTGEEEWNSFLSVLFADEELNLMDYNRVVKDLNGLSSQEFRAEISKVAEEIMSDSIPLRPKQKGEFSLCIGGMWFLYAFRPEYRNNDPVDGLDVALMQEHIFSPILGIENPKEDPRIDFVGGIRGLSELERRCRMDAAAGFALYPVAISELFAVADAGRLMPPKSTWFEPKLRSGLFIHDISG